MSEEKSEKLTITIILFAKAKFSENGLVSSLLNNQYFKFHQNCRVIILNIYSTAVFNISKSSNIPITFLSNIPITYSTEFPE